MFNKTKRLVVVLIIIFYIVFFLVFGMVAYHASKKNKLLYPINPTNTQYDIGQKQLIAASSFEDIDFYCEPEEYDTVLGCNNIDLNNLDINDLVMTVGFPNNVIIDTGNSNYFKNPEFNSVVFSTGKDEVIFSWEDGMLDIIYDANNVTEAAQIVLKAMIEKFPSVKQKICND